MLSANQKKFVNSLKQKKFRKQHSCFVVEGLKIVEELLASDFEVLDIYATQAWNNNNQKVDAQTVTDKELFSISSLKTSNEVLAVVRIPEEVLALSDNLIIVLDCVQDPGNLGTIIRTADWFGINNIVCSTDCVDAYNPKVIQASMGSIFRTNVKYIDLTDFFKENSNKVVYGALLDGEPINSDTVLSKDNSVLLLGNESKGISEKLNQFITNPISIPKIGEAESLNVASAAAILCAEFSK